MLFSTNLHSVLSVWRDTSKKFRTSAFSIFFDFPLREAHRLGLWGCCRGVGDWGKPFATLYHWDLPQYLEDQGGWINRETAYKFAVYADKVSARLGNRVASYATFNEPWCSAFLGYRFGIHAPGLKSDRLGFQAAHHLLLAHGLALPAMRANAPKAQHGIVLNMTPSYANSDSPEDQLAAEFADAENTHTYLQPLLQGRYPTLVFAQHPDWAPIQLAEDLAIMAAPIDFLGINYYTRGVIEKSDSGDYQTVPQADAKTDIGWSIYPAGLTDLLVDLNARYSNLPPVFITENGAADNTDTSRRTQPRRQSTGCQSEYVQCLPDCDEDV